MPVDHHTAHGSMQPASRRSSMWVWWIALTAVFVLVLDTLLVATGASASFDRLIELDVHDALTSSLRPFMLFVSAAGGPATMTAIAVVASLIAMRWGVRWAVLTPIVGVVGSELIETAMKDTFRRHRPHLWATHLAETSFSYPSGHATAAMACAVALTLVTWTSGRRGAALCIGAGGVAAALLIGFSRIALGVHWPTDVLGGWMIGIGWVSAVFLIAQRWAK